MPESVYGILQGTIAQAEKALADGSLPAYMSVPALYHAEILQIFSDWRQKVQSEFPITQLQPWVVKTRAFDMQQVGDSYMGDLRGGCIKEHQFYTETGAVMLPPHLYHLLNPTLRVLFKSFVERGASATTREAADVVKTTWRTNVTMVDLAWERSGHGDVIPGVDFDVGSNPYDFCSKMEEISAALDWAQTLFDYAQSWFVTTARAIKQLRAQIRIEACVGDIAAVLEQIKYGVVGHRAQSIPPDQAVHDTAGGSHGDYPQLYDRIHLSNVLDYIGGSLTLYLYALPLTYPGQEPYITSNCLRNPARLSTVAAFDAEYAGIYAKTDLEKLFHVRLWQRAPDPMSFMMPVMMEYNRWQHHIPSSSSYSDLMPRPKLESWLYRIFLKVCLPFSRPNSDQIIHSPLNLTFFFRVCTHLHAIGSPAHWLSEVTSSILSGKIATNARPPRSEPLSRKEIDQEFTKIDQSVKPFIAEFSTLVAMWQLVLPFGILSPDIAPVELIKKFSITFESVSDEANAWPVFVLIFSDDSVRPSTPSFDLRRCLLSDKMALKDQAAKKFRDGHISIVSTWEWDATAKKATFWLRSDVMQLMQEKEWEVCL